MVRTYVLSVVGLALKETLNLSILCAATCCTYSNISNSGDSQRSQQGEISSVGQPSLSEFWQAGMVLMMCLVGICFTHWGRLPPLWSNCHSVLTEGPAGSLLCPEMLYCRCFAYCRWWRCLWTGKRQWLHKSACCCWLGSHVVFFCSL